MVEMTYVALKPIRVGGERREAGQIIPEAADWPRVQASINQNRIAKVPVASVDQDELVKANEAYEAVKAERAQGETQVQQEEDRPAEAPEETSTPEDDEPPDEPSGVEQFHVGSGWYEIPGLDKKLRRDNAIEYLEGRGEE